MDINEFSLNCIYDICLKEKCEFWDACHGNLKFCPKRIIKDHLIRLSPRDQFIVALYFGFVDNKKYSYAEIGRLLNLTGTRISQIIKDAVGRKYINYLGITEDMVICETTSRNCAYFYSYVFQENLT